MCRSITNRVQFLYTFKKWLDRLLRILYINANDVPPPSVPLNETWIKKKCRRLLFWLHSFPTSSERRRKLAAWIIFLPPSSSFFDLDFDYQKKWRRSRFLIKNKSVNKRLSLYNKEWEKWKGNNNRKLVFLLFFPSIHPLFIHFPADRSGRRIEERWYMTRISLSATVIWNYDKTLAVESRVFNGHIPMDVGLLMQLLYNWARLDGMAHSWLKLQANSVAIFCLLFCSFFFFFSLRSCISSWTCPLNK